MKNFPVRLSREYRGEIVYFERQWLVEYLIGWLIGQGVWNLAFR